MARPQVEHMVEAVPEASDGFERVLKALDVAFQYDSRVEMPRHWRSFSIS